MSAHSDSRREDLRRIQNALELAREVLAPFTPGAIDAQRKEGGDPVTAADLKVDEVLRSTLPQEGEGWLSEETVDDLQRLRCHRVWVVDPLDGTREFVEGIPEWSVSVGLVEDGQPVAGGILNPTTGQMILGSVEHGVTLNGTPVQTLPVSSLEGTTVWASRSEVRRGEWERFRDRGFEIRASGSVAYKLAVVAAGLAEATWTLVPKNEWDVAAGVALVRAAGGWVGVLNDPDRAFNLENPLMEGVVACGPNLVEAIRDEIAAVTGGD